MNMQLYKKYMEELKILSDYNVKVAASSVHQRVREIVASEEITERID